MNILIITPKIPHPLDEGGKISQFAAIDYLRKRHSVILVLTVYNSTDEDSIAILKDLWPEVKIESIQMWNTLLQRQKDKNSVKQLLLKEIKSLTRVVKNLLFKRREPVVCVSELDSPWIAQIASVKNRSFIEQISDIIRKNKVDIIQVDLIDYIDIALAVPKEIKKVFVHHELKFARLATSFSVASTVPAAYKDYILNLVKEQEINFLKSYDGIIVFSESDRNKLAEALPGKKVIVSPFPVMDTFFRPINLELLKVKKLVFVGGEEHTPNKDAIEWYIKEIGIEVKKYHDLTLHVIGNWSSETIRKYRGNNLIFFAGYVEDLVTYCENSIMMVPVRIGSGIRAKILYAMAQGLPVISATVGCEGIEVKDKVDLIIADTPEEFAEAINLLVNDLNYSLNLVTNAQKVVKEKYSQQTAGELRSRCLDEILNIS
jgi:glycosyltransferase involved in cell wall biosynthesis